VVFNRGIYKIIKKYYKNIDALKAVRQRRRELIENGIKKEDIKILVILT
jgi:TRAP-type uncharacterized transport system substrate-binding protein